MTGKTIIVRVILWLTFFYSAGVLPLSSQDLPEYRHHDSILKYLEENEQWRYLTDMYQTYSKTDLPLILHYAGKIETLALAYGSEQEIIDTYRKIGYASFQTGKLLETKEYMEKALVLGRKIQDTVRIIGALTYIGSAEQKAGHYNLALESFLEALALESYYFDSLKIHTRGNFDWNTRGNILNGCGNVHSRLGNPDKALDFHRQALPVYNITGDTTSLAFLYNNMAICHMYKGAFGEAMACLTEGLAYTGENRFDKPRSLLYSNMGNVYWYQEEYDIALEWMLKHLYLNRELGDIADLSSACNSVGGLYLNLGEYEKAEEFLLEGLALAREAHFLMSVQQNLLALSDLEEERKDPGKALKYYKQYMAVKDSIMNEKVTTKVAEMQTRFDTERIANELQIESLKVKNRERLIFGIVIILIFTLITIYLLFNRYKLKQRNQKNKLEKQYLDIEQRLLRAQVNPHFIFNSLNSIKGYMLNRKTEEAATYLDKFATLMRLNLHNSRESFISLADDIHALKIHMELENLRFPHKFNFNIYVDEDIDPERIYVPPLLVQPYVENAILHGLLKKEGQGLLNIRFEKKESKLHITVQDDGIGRAASIEHKPGNKKESLGMKLTLERLELLKSEYGLDISLNIIDLKSESGEAAGTRVELLIPFEEE